MGLMAQRSTASALNAESGSIAEVLHDGEVIQMLDGFEWQVHKAVTVSDAHFGIERHGSEQQQNNSHLREANKDEMQVSDLC